MGKNNKPLPIGTERLNHIGYVEVKTDRRWKDGKVMWECKHRVIWRAANGEIPSDKKVIFKDGDKTNIVLENLQMVDLHHHSEKSINSRFKKGVKVWNAGLKGWQAGGNSTKTQFKKGIIPPNTREVGSEVTHKDGYTYVKVAGMKKVQLKHRILYQEHYKVKLESWQYVSFKDGNKQNFNIDNLELKTRADMMQKNTLHQYPPELKDVIRVLGKVKKTIKKKEKKNEK
jgi:hypothetical protein